MAFKCKKVPVELKLKVPVELKLKVLAELKLKVPVELKAELKKSRKIAAELKFGRGDPSLMRTPSPSGKRSAELKLEWNSNFEIKTLNSYKKQ